MSVDRFDGHINWYWVAGAKVINSRTARSKVDRSWMGGEANPDLVNVCRRHDKLRNDGEFATPLQLKK
ncbi:hypothetical protein MPOCJGCO_4906 [Methylobacterium trifolii]|uniref:HNH endonuclease n=1 Tax=Methylobacterium trifolii TaxID=1003092 RepID=A0ABQ4U5Q6_9HYPH|nr:hypothetical protein MPOCJGCO_4906 [Methylobacterium trifolii]